MKTCCCIRPDSWHQHGQALVLGMLMVGIASIVLLRYFSVGQVVASKTKQLHALDAAAYSGALIQARALNMLSYLNRAQIGHQVAMAHLVTLGSWASLGGHEASQVGMGNPPAYLIAMLFGPDHGAAYLAARTAVGLQAWANTQGQLAQAYAAHSKVVHDVFRSVQDDIVTGLPVARERAIHAVLDQNFSASGPSPDYKLKIIQDSWPGYVRYYTGRHVLRPFVQQVAQMYSFLAPRNHTAKNPWAVDARCPHLRHELRRRGTTELDGSGYWQSMDTQSFHALRSNRWIGCYFREYPMGWGWIPSAADQNISAPYVESPPDDFSSQDFWRWVKEATNWDIVAGDANPLANSKAAVSRQRWQGGGLPAYFDVSADTPQSRLGFALQLWQAGPEGLVFTSRSAAETFFDRPDFRPDLMRESANLFHPYWQSRLSPITTELMP